jgi:hypothetical protein
MTGVAVATGVALAIGVLEGIADGGADGAAVALARASAVDGAGDGCWLPHAATSPVTKASRTATVARTDRSLPNPRVDGWRRSRRRGRRERRGQAALGTAPGDGIVAAVVTVGHRRGLRGSIGIGSRDFNGPDDAR